MSKESAILFLKEGFGDPRVLELLQSRNQPETEAEEIEVYADIAAELGFDFTADELVAAVEEASQERRSATDAKVAGLEKLPDEEFAQVAGGKGDHEYCPTDFWGEEDDCRDTYKNCENCW